MIDRRAILPNGKMGYSMFWAAFAAGFAALAFTLFLTIRHFGAEKPSIWKSFGEVCHIPGTEPEFLLAQKKIAVIAAARLRAIIRSRPNGFTLQLLDTTVEVPRSVTIPLAITASASAAGHKLPAGEWCMAWGNAAGRTVRVFHGGVGRTKFRYHLSEPLEGNINFWFLAPGFNLGAHIPVEGTTWIKLYKTENPAGFRPLLDGFNASGGAHPAWHAYSAFRLTPQSHPSGPALVLWHFQINRRRTEGVFVTTLRRSGFTNARTSQALRQVKRLARRLSPEDFLDLQLTGSLPKVSQSGVADQRLLQVFALSSFYSHYNFPPRCIKAARCSIGTETLYALLLTSASFIRGQESHWMDYYLFDKRGHLSGCGGFHPVATNISSSQLAALAAEISGVIGKGQLHR